MYLMRVLESRNPAISPAPERPPTPLRNSPRNSQAPARRSRTPARPTPAGRHRSSLRLPRRRPGSGQATAPSETAPGGGQTPRPGPQPSRRRHPPSAPVAAPSSAPPATSSAPTGQPARQDLTEPGPNGGRALRAEPCRNPAARAESGCLVLQCEASRGHFSQFFEACEAFSRARAGRRSPERRGSGRAAPRTRARCAFESAASCEKAATARPRGAKACANLRPSSAACGGR
jgi:hypothetical protein